MSDPAGGAYAGTESRFEGGASTQLLLFIFLTSLSGAVWLIETRRLGIARRMLFTPTSTRTILGGQVLGRLAIALVQALISCSARCWPSASRGAIRSEPRR